MNLIERREDLKKLKDELAQLESRAELLMKDGVNWELYDRKPYEIDKYALLSKIFVAEKGIEVWEENNRYRKAVGRVITIRNVLERVEKIAIERNSKIAKLISEEIAKREWEDK